MTISDLVYGSQLDKFNQSASANGSMIKILSFTNKFLLIIAERAGANG